MEGDDVPVGRVLSRREVLTVLGASGLALIAGGATDPSAWAASRRRVPACVARPAQTEGPYFVDRMLARSDIRSDPSSGAVKEGVPLALTIAVSSIGAGKCTPLAGAHVDIWQCDAAGVYSGVEDPGFNTVGKSFLRGYQLTDQGGEAGFRTIYPGWYPGRAVHIHFKIRTDPAASQGHEFTSQIYFDEKVNDRVFGRMPYSAKTGRRDRNADDRFFTSGGDQLLVTPRAAGDGYEARFDVGLQLS
jgi:protocatechuate 3,4-dioxygenase beta subunit